MIYLSAIFLSFFLAFVLFTKREKNSADYILLAWLVVLGVHMLTFYLFFTKQLYNFPYVVVMGFPLPLAHGPFLYLYTKQQTSASPFGLKQLFHFLPMAISYLLFANFFMLPLEQQQEIIDSQGVGYETQTMINRFAIYLSGIIYVSLSLVRLLKFRRNLVHQFSNTEKINFNWLLYLIIWIMAIWVVVLFIGEDEWIYLAASLFILWLGYFGIRQVRVFSQHTPPLFADSPSPERDEIIIEEDLPAAPDDTESSENTSSQKYQKSSLSEADATTIHERLNTLFVEQKPYKNPDLTLNELAKSLEVHPNHLSQVINSREHKNFYDLVNEWRVEEFINLVSSPASQQFTLLGLALDCGFNSKASFNRNFKKYKQVTPSDFLKGKEYSR